MTKRHLCFIAVNIPNCLLQEKVEAVGTTNVQVVGTRLLAMTSRLMEWSEGRWILDMTPCYKYWSHQALIHGISFQEMIKRQLKGVLGEPLSAAWTDHPWRSVLLAAYMEERGLQGLLVMEGDWGGTPGDVSPLQITGKLVRDLTWDSWWLSWSILIGHLHRQKKNQLAVLRREGFTMQKAVRRLGCKFPYEWVSMAPYSLGRRFGKTIQQVWSWTYQHSNYPGWQMIEFPWESFYARQSPAVVRHLEHQVQEWSHLEAWLKLDFDRLCKHPSLGVNEGVLLIEWALFFDDCQEKEVPIVFRYPHRLQSEQGHHRTSCLQALYSFERHFKNDIDPTLPQPFVTGWRLVIKESLAQSDEQRDLFGEKSILTFGEKSSRREKSDLSLRYLELVQMENRLSISLLSYKLVDDWTPEDGFVEYGEQNKIIFVHNNRMSLDILANKRPLYIYRDPVIYHPSKNARFYFMERSMVKWWKDTGKSYRRSCVESLKDDFLLCKDFYRVEDLKENQYLWIYRESNTGEWFVQGVYA